MKINGAEDEMTKMPITSLQSATEMRTTVCTRIALLASLRIFIYFNEVSFALLSSLPIVLIWGCFNGDI